MLCYSNGTDNKLKKLHNRNVMFQQDGAVIHRVHETAKLLKAVCSQTRFHPTKLVATKQSGLEPGGLQDLGHATLEERV